MGCSNDFSNRGFLPLLSTVALMMVVAVQISSIPTANAFTLHQPSSRSVRAVYSPSTTTSLFAMNKKTGKFNKQKDLAAKMAEAKRLRDVADGTIIETPDAEESPTDKEIKLRNDKQRFADLLENSMTGMGGDLDKGYYLTMEQETENADAVFKGVVRLYEGDPAPTSPFAELLNIENGEPLGQGGMKRLVPWEGSKSGDYLVVVTDPRPKSAELRTAMKRLSGALPPDKLKKCLVINTDTPAENRRFIKKNLEESPLNIMCDENLEWMREYTALGEKRFSMTMFVLKEGRVEKLAREVEAESLAMAVTNAIRGL